ncbi:MAG: enoyl-CoA hydratase/isomerase family protein [Candidatus Handelsmanbacteria bacterium]|nr:enoyl-CoA hydratase/isomerase family protein [Candidatus Handelsmanbacteria bacterium]
MAQPPLPSIRRAAVLGAGVMGAQLAALAANAGLEVDLLDLSPELAAKGLERAVKRGAFFLPEFAARVHMGSLENLDCLAKTDWVIEAIVEEMGAKQALLARLDPWARPGLVFSTNTSGLGIGRMLEGRSELLARHFLGLHFFNPPRQMKLVELIPGPRTDPQVVADMGRFAREVLGKRVVECLDTPNFIANRLGVFALVEMLRRLEEGFGIAEVDAVSGVLLGRPRSATLRLCDLIGLDTLADVAGTARQLLPESACFALPGFVGEMLKRGLVGEKAKAGFYRKGEEGLQVLDLGSFNYVPLAPVGLGELEPALRLPALGDRLRALWASKVRLGMLARSHLQAVLDYAAEYAAQMAPDLEAIDQAMRWGFNWEAGPFELWDLLGLQAEPAPALIRQVRPVGRFYPPGQVYSLREGRHRDQPRREGLLEKGRVLLEAPGAALIEIGEGMGVLVLRGKLNVIDAQTLDLVRRSLDQPLRGLVLWGSGGLFSAGADLKHLAALSTAGDWQGLEVFLCAFQEAVMALRFAPFPVVAALRGLTLGGGCEFGISVGVRVAGAELRMGLVEARVGLLPGAGGCKEVVRRCGRDLAAIFPVLVEGRYSENAHQARQWGFLAGADPVLLDEEGVLGRALADAAALAARYTPPVPASLEVAGEPGLARCRAWLEKEAFSLGPHDRVVGEALARVLCGGGGPPRAAEEQELLDLEREEFHRLCRLPATQARIEHMLKTGKPLKN